MTGTPNNGPFRTFDDVHKQTPDAALKGMVDTLTSSSDPASFEPRNVDEALARRIAIENRADPSAMKS